MANNDRSAFVDSQWDQWYANTKTKWLDRNRVNIDFTPLVDEIDLLTQHVKSKIAQIQSKRSSMSIADMFDLQMAMNKLSQFTEMSTSVISAMNTSVNNVARNIKG